MIGGKPLDASIHARPFPPLLIFGHDCFSAVSSVPCARLSGVTVNGGFDLNLNQPDFRGRDTWLFRFCHGRQFGVNKHLPSKDIHPEIVHKSIKIIFMDFETSF
jgi:hypothetical protein